uniref:Antitoxin n=1 Tax=Candidatus Kentrum sp. DK TaxID=2126562 RepID=A0A450S8R2_9GAMM|nr:MAG: antitoxin StbD [Candidatus Kentron sp. DK]
MAPILPRNFRERTSAYNLANKIMKEMFANITASLSELRETPSALLLEAASAPIAILDRGRPTAYLICAETFEWMRERIDDDELLQIARERQSQKNEAIEVTLDAL